MPILRGDYFLPYADVEITQWHLATVVCDRVYRHCLFDDTRRHAVRALFSTIDYCMPGGWACPTTPRFSQHVEHPPTPPQLPAGTLYLPQYRWQCALSCDTACREGITYRVTGGVCVVGRWSGIPQTCGLTAHATLPTPTTVPTCAQLCHMPPAQHPPPDCGPPGPPYSVQPVIEDIDTVTNDILFHYSFQIYYPVSVILFSFIVYLYIVGTDTVGEHYLVAAALFDPSMGDVFYSVVAALCITDIPTGGGRRRRGGGAWYDNTRISVYKRTIFLWP